MKGSKPFKANPRAKPPPALAREALDGCRGPGLELLVVDHSVQGYALWEHLHTFDESRVHRLWYKHDVGR